MKVSSEIFHGDCAGLLANLRSESVDLVFTSPPYCIGKPYERVKTIADFTKLLEEVIPPLVRVTREGGSICWQVGAHIRNGVLTPLDYVVFGLMSKIPGVVLRNRIVWTFGHGLHSTNKFSGRHEVILWFSKGTPKMFNLDSVRVPQRYPGKTHASGPNKGKPSGNPRGKNPGDVWEVPNVKARHVEKTLHPCQFPVALPQRFVRALTQRGDLVLDPFMGSGTTGVAAAMEKRSFVGAEVKADYVEIARQRIQDAQLGVASVRPWNQSVLSPDPSKKVAKMPEGHFLFNEMP